MEFACGRKVFDLGKVQSQDLIGRRVGPKAFNGQSVKVAEPVLEQRLEGRDQQGFPEAARAGEKELFTSGCKLMDQGCFVDVDLALMAQCCKIRRSQRERLQRLAGHSFFPVLDPCSRLNPTVIA